MATKKKPGVVPVAGGKEYKMVVARVEEFRTNEITRDWGINTEILFHSPDESCVIKASIFDETGRLRGSGIANDRIDHSKLHRKSFMELCETSAIGRALSSIGLAGGTEYASADEVYYALQDTVKADPASPKPKAEPKAEPKTELKVVEKVATDEEAAKAQRLAWAKLNSLAGTMSKQTFLDNHWEPYTKTAPQKFVDAILASSMPIWLEAFDAREK